MSPGIPQLTLYVAGNSAASRRAQANLKAVLAELKATLPVRVVDVLSAPDEALSERIYVTPALLVHVAGQREMLVGDFSQHHAVVTALLALTNEAAATTEKASGGADRSPLA